MSGKDILIEAVKKMPLPKAPPRMSRTGAAVGLSFLDTSLRQNHVRRITERLSIVEDGAPTRRVQVDLSLALLDDGQREASRTFSRLRSPVEQPSTSALWVPIARLPRADVMPVEVADATGPLPRLTQHETSRLFASGLYNLLRSVLRASAKQERRSEKSGGGELGADELRTFLQEDDAARWLVQQALLGLTSERALPLAASDPARLETSRKRAIEILTAESPGMNEFHELLDYVTHQYLLIVAIDQDEDEVSLTFEAPLSRDDFEIKLERLKGTYYFAYHSTLPSSLRSFHLQAECEPNVHISSMTLNTDADGAEVRHLADDLLTLSRELKTTQSQLDDSKPTVVAEAVALRSVLAIELYSAVGRLKEIVRQRSWQAEAAGCDLDDSVRELVDLCDDFSPSSPLDTSPEKLDGCADHVRQLEPDLAIENHPASSVGHVYWRRTPARTIQARFIRATASIALVDAGGSRPRAIQLFALGVLGVQVLLAALVMSAGRWSWNWTGNELTQADAAVALLLLVPGFLYTRLDLPDWGLISGRLRELSRILAIATLASAIVLALTIAAGIAGNALKWAFLLSLLVPLASVIIIGTRPVAEAPAHLPKWAAARPRSDLPAKRPIAENEGAGIIQ